MAKRKAVEGELLPAAGGALTQDEDELFVTQAGRLVLEFFKGVAGFFTTAKALEETALATRDRARALPFPKTAEEDERVQQFIRKAASDKRDVLAHWQITATVSGFHRRLTARRAKSEDALDEAIRLANAQHNGYVQAETRRVQEETRRREQEAEEQARKDREAELARLEAEAVKREESAPVLSARESVFVEQLLAHGDGIRAARQAGFPDFAKSSTRLLKLAKIQAAIKVGEEAKAIRQQATARAARPLDVGPVQPVMPNVNRAVGSSSRVYHYADLVDEQALIRAILAGDRGIPVDLLRIDPSVLNRYAKDLGDRVREWPGVVYRKETKLV